VSDDIWKSVLGEIELSLSQAGYVTWFKNTRLIKIDDESAIVAVPNVFVKQTLEKRYSQTVLDVLARLGKNPAHIEFKIQSSLLQNKKTSQAKEEQTMPLLETSLPSNSQISNVQTSAVSHGYRYGLNDRYGFDNFIVGSGSELAYAACNAVAGSPGTKYNPLFLYGGVGIGKTHLIQAVGNEIAKKPGTRVLYITIEQFVQEFLDSIRYKKVGSFAEHYRSADALIVDDIQFIAGKEKTQEEFFHTFNALYQANKQIIISSDRPPKDIPTLQDRLLSRFSSGMIIDMQAPDFETRCAIVQTKAQQLDVTLTPDVVELVARHASQNVRELEGVLNQLLAHCEMRNTVPTLEIAQYVFHSAKLRPKHITAKHIIEKTARHFSVTFEDLIGPRRDKEYVKPRQLAMYLLRSELHFSFPKIAHELGRKDHTTAIYSVEKMSHEAAEGGPLHEHMKQLKEKIYA
jgi:chromosomal replication initiator protein